MSKAKTKPTRKPTPKPNPPDAEFELDVAGEWTGEHTKVIAQLLVDLDANEERKK